MKAILTILFLVFATIATAQPPSGNQINYSGGRLRLGQPTFANPYYVPNDSYLTIGTNNRRSVPTARHFLASDTNLPLTISGNSKYYVGNRTYLDFQGTTISPQIFGNFVGIFSNSLFVSGTSRIYGTYAFADVGAPVTEAYGGAFSAYSGGAGASGAGTIMGVQGLAGMAHNGNLTTAIGGDFAVTGTTSSPSVTTNAFAARARLTFQTGTTATNVRGISISDWFSNGGVAQNTVGIYADTSIDVGTVTKYFIRSLSTSPSTLAGDVAISDSTKGIILKSPNGTCYRFTVANGGALNAGASVTCP